MAENISRRRMIGLGLGLGAGAVLSPILDSKQALAQVEESPIIKMSIIKPSDAAVHDGEVDKLQSAVFSVRDWYLKKVGATFDVKEGVQIIDLASITTAQVLEQGDGGWQTGVKAVSKGALSTRKDTLEIIVMLGGDFLGQGGTWTPDRSSGYLVLGNPVYQLISNRPSDGPEWLNTYNQALGVVAHELGHAFGLPHPKDSEGDLTGRIMAGDIGAFPDRAILVESEIEQLRMNPFLRN